MVSKDISHDMFMFVENTPKIFKCPRCNIVMIEPVTVKCGHSFCSHCAKTMDKCSVDGIKIEKKQFFPNIVLASQINELLIYCKYGIKLDSVSNKLQLDSSGCQEKIRLEERSEHERICTFKTIKCKCGYSLREKDLVEHRKICKMTNKKEDGNFIPADQKLPSRSNTGAAASSSVIAEVQQISDNLTLRMKRFETQMGASLQRMESMYLEMQLILSGIMAALNLPQSEQARASPSLSSSSAISTSNRSFTGAAAARMGPIFKDYMQRISSTSCVRMDQASTRWVCPFQFLDVGILRGHKQPITCMSYLDSLLITGYQDHLVRVWDVAVFIRGEFGKILNNGGCLAILEGHAQPIVSICVNPVRKEAASFDRVSVKIWNLNKYTLDRELSMSDVDESGPESVSCVMMTRTRLLLSIRSHLLIFELTSLIRLARIDNSMVSGRVSCLALIELPTAGVSGSLYVAAHNCIQVWRLSDSHSIDTLNNNNTLPLELNQEKRDSISSLNNSPDHGKGSIKANQSIHSDNSYSSGAMSNEVTLVNTIQHNFYSAQSLLVSSSYIVIGTYNRNIQMFNRATGEHLYSLTGHVSSVNALAITDSESHLVSVGAEGYVNIWELDRGVMIQSLKIPGDICGSGIVIKGHVLFVSASDGEIKLFRYDKFW